MPYLNDKEMGYRQTDTSHAAAAEEQSRASTVRAQVLMCIKRNGPMTADAVADHLGYTPFTVRPRVTELKNAGKIEDTGDRGFNASGKRAAMFKAKND